MCTHLDKTGSTYYFRRPVPKDLVGHFVTATGKPRTEWKFSLGTKDREDAKRLLRPHVSETDSLIDDARRALQIEPQRSPEELAAMQREQWQREAQEAVETLRAARRAAREPHRGRVRRVTQMLSSELDPEDAAINDVINERVASALASHGIAPDGAEVPAIATAATSSDIGIKALFERYGRSGAANAKTIDKWRGRVANLVDFLEHDDASRVTRADLNRWVEGLVSKGLTKKTVVDGYLPAVRVAFGIAHDDGAIAANPASGLRVRAPKAVQLRERDLTDDEADTILKAASGQHSDRLAPEHVLARRWVPWLCAYTGARVAEMTQLRAMDIKRDGGVWVVHITPEAGSVKTGKARSVPIHSHLIEQGILELAKPGDASPLFYREGAGNEINPAHKVRAADLAKWVRTLGVNDPEVQPNHGWRHRFKTITRAVGIPEYEAERIQGHTPRHEGGKYGSGSLTALRDAIERIPRYRAGRE